MGGSWTADRCQDGIGNYDSNKMFRHHGLHPVVVQKNEMPWKDYNTE